MERGQNKTKQHPKTTPKPHNQQNTGQETLESALECTCMGETKSETEVGLRDWPSEMRYEMLAGTS